METSAEPPGVGPVAFRSVVCAAVNGDPPGGPFTGRCRTPTQLRAARSTRVPFAQILREIRELLLLARVAAIPGSVSAVEQLQLAAFVARQEHRAVLREAYERAPISATTLAPDSAGAALVAEVLRAP